MTDGREPTVEELAAAQKEFEAKNKSEEDEAARKAAEEERLRQVAGEDTAQRGEIIGQMKSFSGELKKMEAAGIKHRMERASTIREGILAKQEELARGEEDFKSLEERLKSLTEIISGKSDEEIAPQVKEALVNARSNLQEASTQRSTLTQQIEQSQSQLVSDQEVQRYNALLEVVAKLDEEITAIEANPQVIELIYKEAKTEDEIRDQVIRAAENSPDFYGRTNSNERRNFVNTVVQKFLSIEFRDQGCDSPQKMKTVASALSYGLSGQRREPFQIMRDKDVPADWKTNAIKANALRSMLGTFGSADSLGFLANPNFTGQGLDRSQYNSIVARELRRYLPIYNYILAQNEGFGQYYSSRIVGQFHRENLVQASHDLKMNSTYEGPMVPQESSETEKQEITETYERERDRARDKAVGLWQRESITLEESIARVQSEIAAARSNAESHGSAKNVLDNYRKQHPYPESDKELVGRLRGEYQNIESDLNSAIKARQGIEDEQSRAGWLAKRRLSREISEADEKIARLTELRDNAEEILRLCQDAGGIADPTYKNNIDRQIYELNYRLEGLVREQQSLLGRKLEPTHSVETS